MLNPAGIPLEMCIRDREEAKRRGLRHEEYHSKVEYLVAHGIASTVDEERVLIGSAHFVFEDEGCVIPEGEQERFEMCIRDSGPSIWCAVWARC